MKIPLHFDEKIKPFSIIFCVNKFIFLPYWGNVINELYLSVSREKSRDINYTCRLDVSLDYLYERQNGNLIFTDSLTDKKKELFKICKCWQKTIKIHKLKIKN